MHDILIDATYKRPRRVGDVRHGNPNHATRRPYVNESDDPWRSYKMQNQISTRTRERSMIGGYDPYITAAPLGRVVFGFAAVPRATFAAWGVRRLVGFDAVRGDWVLQ